MENDVLRQIGFYTLEDKRAASCSHKSPLWRCELLVTPRCNFNCPYCRSRDFPELTREEAKKILISWILEGLRNVRFSGGEPTIWPHLLEMAAFCKANNVEHIAISTNGSADFTLYEQLIEAGVNDFSVSLDACCASTGKIMSGKESVWERVVSNIRKLSKLTYVTVGVVLTNDNVEEAERIITFAHELGVADIRVIPAAQVSRLLPQLYVDPDILLQHPILKYRIDNVRKGRWIRGMGREDTCRCPLVLDDMAVEDGKHYPCIIYLREGGDAIGEVGPNMREERLMWFIHHDCKKDRICSENCLDVCVDYNNRVSDLGNV
jgi:MoaA/NifB/PqqE/SkfB family radical SAM enzyme